MDILRAQNVIIQDKIQIHIFPQKKNYCQKTNKLYQNNNFYISDTLSLHFFLNDIFNNITLNTFCEIISHKFNVQIENIHINYLIQIWLIYAKFIRSIYHQLIMVLRKHKFFFSFFATNLSQRKAGTNILSKIIESLLDTNIRSLV